MLSDMKLWIFTRVVYAQQLLAVAGARGMCYCIYSTACELFQVNITSCLSVEVVPTFKLFT